MELEEFVEELERRLKGADDHIQEQKSTAWGHRRVRLADTQIGIKQARAIVSEMKPLIGKG